MGTAPYNPSGDARIARAVSLRGRRVTTAAIVLAGGTGTRFGAEEGKAHVPLGGQPLLSWSLAAFQASPLIGVIVAVVRRADLARTRSLVAAQELSKVRTVTEGGATRHESEYQGLLALVADIETEALDVVCVHDAARPFVALDLLERVVEEATAHGGAVPCVPFEEPALLRTDEHGSAAGTVPTEQIRRAQTPQAFRARGLLEAHRAAAAAGFCGYDTAECVERFGDLTVREVAGDPDNVKVTFAEDLATAERIAGGRGPLHRGP